MPYIVVCDINCIIVGSISCILLFHVVKILLSCPFLNCREIQRQCYHGNNKDCGFGHLVEYFVLDFVCAVSLLFLGHFKN